jgi:hypothetical protein
LIKIFITPLFNTGGVFLFYTFGVNYFTLFECPNIEKKILEKFLGNLEYNSYVYKKIFVV